ncbi:MAG: hypothetical protein OZ922_00165 [Myxococcales bacterium]|nr:hypothetical protein [Myxococcales bacterium]
MRAAVVWGAAAVAAALAVAGGVAVLQRAPAGPIEPAWDREPCAHCRMHLSEPGFAAQLRTADGAVLFFDDPGCLFLRQAGSRERPQAVYFHHVREDRWLTAAEVGFVGGERTPMGWGFAAVAADEPGAVALEVARAAVLAAADAAVRASGKEPHGRAAR